MLKDRFDGIVSGFTERQIWLHCVRFHRKTDLMALCQVSQKDRFDCIVSGFTERQIWLHCVRFHRKTDLMALCQVSQKDLMALCQVSQKDRFDGIVSGFTERQIWWHCVRFHIKLKWHHLLSEIWCTSNRQTYAEWLSFWHVTSKHFWSDSVLPVEQIRWVFGDNWKIIFINSPYKHMLWVLIRIASPWRF